MAEAKKSQGPRLSSSLASLDDEYETIYDPPGQKLKDNRATKTAHHLGTVNAVDEVTEYEKVEELGDTVTYCFAQGGVDSDGLAGGKSVQQIKTFDSVDGGRAQHVNENSSAGVSSVQQVSAFVSTAGGGSVQQVNTNSSAGAQASESQNDAKDSPSQTNQGGGGILKRLGAMLSRSSSPRAISPSPQSESNTQRQTTSANPVTGITDSMVPARGSQGRPPSGTLVPNTIALSTGLLTLPNGDTYEGQFIDGRRNGRGCYRFASGAVYNGEWYENSKQGQGIYYYTDGSRYEGGWVNDQRVGYGTYFYFNGDIFQGNWANHLRHGSGVYIYAETGIRYSGQWLNGNRMVNYLRSTILTPSNQDMESSAAGVRLSANPVLRSSLDPKSASRPTSAEKQSTIAKQSSTERQLAGQSAINSRTTSGVVAQQSVPDQPGFGRNSSRASQVLNQVINYNKLETRGPSSPQVGANQSQTLTRPASQFQPITPTYQETIIRSTQIQNQDLQDPVKASQAPYQDSQRVTRSQDQPLEMKKSSPIQAPYQVSASQNQYQSGTSQFQNGPRTGEAQNVDSVRLSQTGNLDPTKPSQTPNSNFTRLSQSRNLDAT